MAADHSKHDRLFPARYAPWRDIDHIVTDTAPGDALKDSQGKNGVTLTIC